MSVRDEILSGSFGAGYVCVLPSPTLNFRERLSLSSIKQVLLVQRKANLKSHRMLKEALLHAGATHYMFTIITEVPTLF